MLQSLTVIFKNVFTNPSSSRFAWIGAYTADVIFLNDYRWMQSQITWDDFLHLLEEGQVVHVPAPMNHFSRKIKIDVDVPIFATSISEIKLFSRSNELLKVFHFDQIIPTAQQVKAQRCGHCFCNLVLVGEDEA